MISFAAAVATLRVFDERLAREFRVARLSFTGWSGPEG
jgi:hypothetical protein